MAFDKHVIILDIREALFLRYGDRWSDAKKKLKNGLCGFKKCRNEYTEIYYNIPLCPKHVNWIELKIEELIDTVANCEKELE